MSKQRSEVNDQEGVKPSADAIPQPGANHPTETDGNPYDNQLDRRRGAVKVDPDRPKPAPRGVDMTNVIRRAHENVNVVDAGGEAFRSIAALVREIKGPEDVEALALGLERGADDFGYALAQGTGAEGQTGIVGKV